MRVEHPFAGIVNVYTRHGNIQVRWLPRAPMGFADRHYPQRFPHWVTWGPVQIRFVAWRWHAR